MKIVRNIFLSLTLLVSPAFVLAIVVEDDMEEVIAREEGLPVEVNNNESIEEKKSFSVGAGFVSAVLFVPSSVGSVIKYFADKTYVISMVGKIATCGLFNENFVGNFIKKHKNCIGSMVFTAAVGSVSYLAWNKYQEWKKQQDEDYDFRAFFDEEDEEPATEEAVGN